MPLCKLTDEASVSIPARSTCEPEEVAASVQTEVDAEMTAAVVEEAAMPAVAPMEPIDEDPRITLFRTELESMKATVQAHAAEDLPIHQQMCGLRAQAIMVRRLTERLGAAAASLTSAYAELDVEHGRLVERRLDQHEVSVKRAVDLKMPAPDPPRGLAAVSAPPWLNSVSAVAALTSEAWEQTKATPASVADRGNIGALRQRALDAVTSYARAVAAASDAPWDEQEYEDALHSCSEENHGMNVFAEHLGPETACCDDGTLAFTDEFATRLPPDYEFTALARSPTPKTTTEVCATNEEVMDEYESCAVSHTPTPEEVSAALKARLNFLTARTLTKQWFEK